jgi:hypothetical protein
VSFAEALLRRMQPEAKVYVINLDDFAMEVMNDPERDPTTRPSVSGNSSTSGFAKWLLFFRP